MNIVPCHGVETSASYQYSDLSALVSPSLLELGTQEIDGRITPQVRYIWELGVYGRVNEHKGELLIEFYNFKEQNITISDKLLIT